MKITMVSEHASPLAAVGGVDSGGQNLHVAELAKALARRGHEVRVASRQDGRYPCDPVEFAPGVVVEHIPAGPAEPLPKDALLPYMADFGAYLAHAWSTDAPDVVHAHFWMSGLAALSGARERGIPVVQTFHALGSVKQRHQGAKDTSPPGRVRLERALARSVARVVATCSDEVFELARLGVQRRQISVVPCGVDLDQFTDRGPVAPRPECPRILSVGRLVERKGFDILVRALPAVPHAELLVAGGPPAAELDTDPEARRLRTLAAACGVADRVHLLGAVSRDDMPVLMRSADVVACAPWYEPFGMVPVEAMACGVPVVAAAVGGLTDTVIDGVTGLLVPPRRPDRMAAALRTVLADANLRLAFRSAALDRARSRYAWDRIAAETHRVYGDVTARAGGRMGAAR
ncbi:MAG TPA: glycosyltransferase [Mycobacteriales bacterium]|jgi:glycosyltransferase involved in cell wall biosynthesis|nr:glycosyltransferase [Mycobacteriales bacterium]